jgi:hypothetical protein
MVGILGVWASSSISHLLAIWLTSLARAPGPKAILGLGLGSRALAHLLADRENDSGKVISAEIWHLIVGRAAASLAGGHEGIEAEELGRHLLRGECRDQRTKMLECRVSNPPEGLGFRV